MNQGFAAASADWLLFWGSDDWAAAPTVLAEAIAALEAAGTDGPDLLVCRGRYVAAATGAPGRVTRFHGPGRLGAAAYRRALLLGSTPPHQATFFGPGARQRLARYAPDFRLAADLDYFLQLSFLQFRSPGSSTPTALRVQCLDLELVQIAAGGISGQQPQRRLQEVRRAYRRAFGVLWWCPFVARYLRRLASLVPVCSPSRLPWRDRRS
jgi:hypothetical protein